MWCSTLGPDSVVELVKRLARLEQGSLSGALSAHERTFRVQT
jgi:hypothetical protein